MPLTMGYEEVAVGAGWSWRRAVALLVLAHSCLLAWMGLTHHWGFQSSLNDLGMFDQAVWGILHGQPFINTTSPFHEPINWLGWHFTPVLLFFVPFYALVESPVWLTLAQAAALSLAAWPIFLLARRMTGSETAAGWWAVAYLANPLLLSAAAWDFHGVCLGVPFAALGLLAVESRNPRLLAGCCLVLLTVQEHMGLMVGGFGALWWLRHGDRKYGAILMGLGLAYTGLVLGVVMPALSPSGTHPMLSESVGFASRYGWLGKTPGEMAARLLFHPLDFARTVLVDMGGGGYLAILLIPLLFYPLAGAVFLLPAMADLAVNLLSSNPLPRSLFSYHSIGLLPPLMAAAIHGCRRLSRWQGWFGVTRLSGLAAGFSLAFGYLMAPLPLPGAADFWAAARYPLGPDPGLAAVRAVLPPGAWVSAQANIGAHLSHREGIHVFPFGMETDDFIVLHLDSPTRKLGFLERGFLATLAHHLQMNPATYLDTAAGLLADPDRGVVLWRDNWLVLARNAAPPAPALRTEIAGRLAELRSTWRGDH